MQSQERRGNSLAKLVDEMIQLAREECERKEIMPNQPVWRNYRTREPTRTQLNRKLTEKGKI